MAGKTKFKMSEELKNFLNAFKLNAGNFRLSYLREWEKEYYLEESKKFNVKRVEMYRFLTYLENIRG